MRRAALIRVAVEEVDKLRAAFAGVDPASIQQKRIVRKASRCCSRLPRTSIEQIHAASDRFLCYGVYRERRLQKGSFKGGIVGDRCGPREHLPVDAEMDRRFIMCRGCEDAALR